MFPVRPCWRGQKYLLALEEISPNYFDNEHDIPHGKMAWFSISDVTGRTVYSLTDRSLNGGNYSFVWSGESDVGELLPAGVYILHLVSQDVHMNQKILLLK